MTVCCYGYQELIGDCLHPGRINFLQIAAILGYQVENI